MLSVSLSESRWCTPADPCFGWRRPKARKREAACRCRQPGGGEVHWPLLDHSLQRCCPASATSVASTWYQLRRRQQTAVHKWVRCGVIQSYMCCFSCSAILGGCSLWVHTRQPTTNILYIGFFFGRAQSTFFVKNVISQMVLQSILKSKSLYKLTFLVSAPNSSDYSIYFWETSGLEWL
jgi:hypothetical protein